MNLDEKPTFTDDPRRIQWLKYFRRIADMYGLKDWVIEMANEEPSDRSAYASCYIPPGRKLSWIRLSHNFITETPQAQRLCVVHELTHCHHHLRFAFAQQYIPEVMKETHSTLEEYVIDSISTAIAYIFPLPTDEERGCTS